MLDTMARFVEGADSEVIKDHSSIFEDDEKIIRIKAQRNKDQSKDTSVQEKQIDQKDKGRQVIDKSERGARGGRGRGRGDRLIDPQSNRSSRPKDQTIDPSNVDQNDYDSKPSNRDPRESNRGMRGMRGGDRGNRGRGDAAVRGRGRGEGRGGYREDYQRDETVFKDDDDYYTKKQPTLIQDRETYSDEDSSQPSGAGRGDRGGLRGRGNRGNT